MHRNASFTAAINDLTKLSQLSSEQHIDAAATKVSWDYEHTEKLVAYFEIHNPFDSEYTDLTSLSTGLSASRKDNVNFDNVDCDKAIGYEIQNKCVA